MTKRGKYSPEDEVRTPAQIRLALKKHVRMFYDIQRLRIQCSGRVLPKAETAEVQLHEIDLIALNNRAKELSGTEKEAKREVENALKAVSFYRDVLSDKKLYMGVGPTMAGVILSEFDIDKADTPSKFWSFAGLAPVACKRCKHCHVVVEHESREVGGLAFYKHKASKIKCPTKDNGQKLYDKDVYDSGMSARPKRGEKLSYNAFLRTKLCGVLGPVLVKCRSPWTKHYYEYNHRKKTAGWGTSDKHRQLASIRYMVKMLLLDIWRAWRQYENLPVRPSYHEEKQRGHGYKPPSQDVA